MKGIILIFRCHIIDAGRTTMVLPAQWSLLHVLSLLSKSSETTTLLFDTFVAMNGSSIRADCQWTNADYMKNNNTTVLPMIPKSKGINKGQLQPRPDNGKLPADVSEPKFVADPNHRRKGLTGELIKLDMSRKDLKLKMTRMDSTRIGKNFGYMARTLKNRSEDELELAAASVLEHHFDCHTHCGDWCRRKLETDEQKKMSKKYYRCKIRDAELYVLYYKRPLKGLLPRTD
jgi:hypothetical protein